MKRVASISLLCVAIAAGFVSTDVREGFARAERESCALQGKGEWSFSAHPYVGEGYESRPVVVSAVRTIAKTLTISEVRVRNISSKSVAAIKIGWFVTNSSLGPEPVLKGESALIPMEKGLVSGETSLLKLPLMSFVELRRGLSEKGRLRGEFDAQVFVSNVYFDDATQWKVGDKVAVSKQTFDVSIINTAFAKSTAGLSVMTLNKAAACPRQMCKYDYGPPPGYFCGSSNNDEYCTNCVSSCCNTLCSDPTPSCGPCN